MKKVNLVGKSADLMLAEAYLLNGEFSQGEALYKKYKIKLPKTSVVECAKTAFSKGNLSEAVLVYRFLGDLEMLRKIALRYEENKNFTNASILYRELADKISLHRVVLKLECEINEGFQEIKRYDHVRSLGELLDALVFLDDKKRLEEWADKIAATEENYSSRPALKFYLAAKITKKLGAFCWKRFESYKKQSGNLRSDVAEFFAAAHCDEGVLECLFYLATRVMEEDFRHSGYSEILNEMVEIGRMAKGILPLRIKLFPLIQSGLSKNRDERCCKLATFVAEYELEKKGESKKKK